MRPLAGTHWMMGCSMEPESLYACMARMHSIRSSAWQFRMVPHATGRSKGEVSCGMGWVGGRISFFL